MNLENYKSGALISPPDERDYKITRCMDIPTCGIAESVPATYECWIPSTNYDQGTTCSCTAFAMATIFSCIWHKRTGEERDFSTGFIYSNPVSGWLWEGAYMRDVCNTVLKDGDILAVIGDNNDEKPESIKWFEEHYPKFKEYSKLLIDSYVRLETKEEAMAFLYKYQTPLFVNLRMGDITPLATNKDGLHAVVAYKYGRVSGFSCKNSWGDNIPFITNKQFKTFKEVWGIVPKEEINFNDITTDMWGYDDMMTAAKDGIIKGLTDNTFGPDVPLTRRQISVIWGRMKRYLDENYVGVVDVNPE